MNAPFAINDRPIGPGEPVYTVAEMSANHGGEFETAMRIVRAAADAGADAIKCQTYTPDTLTLDCGTEPFVLENTAWEGRRLYDLYEEAHTPWEWQEQLRREAHAHGLDFFSTAFDASSVDFLEDLGVPLLKTASFEIVDLPLIRRMSRTGKPLVLSTGMASLGEIDEAVRAARSGASDRVLLLKCTSSYPAEPEQMNLRTIPNMRETFGVPVGLSDHTRSLEVPVAAVALGARMVEKHFTLSRDLETPDSAFSLEPDEFAAMVERVRTVERALGTIDYGAGEAERESRVFRRSLFVVEDVAAGETFTEQNVRRIRPGDGLAPKHYGTVLGRSAARDVPRGTPLSWELVE